MNRGFLHKDYAYLKPQYHFIIDEKLNNGIWPITFIDEIFSLNPNVKLFLNLKWSKNKKFYSYKKKSNMLIESFGLIQDFFLQNLIVTKKLI